MKSNILLLLLLAKASCLFAIDDTLKVKRTNDFSIDGKGSHNNWSAAEWVQLKQLDSGNSTYHTKFKILYSEKGVYVLFDGIDSKITSTYKKDFSNMFNADVFEVFFHTDPALPLYFEYEVNAYNKELVLLIPNLDGNLMGWIPWHYEGERKVVKKVFVQKKKGKMEKWTAEMFFPYKLLSPLKNVPPVKGTTWHANFYRLDYDGGKMTKFAWRPVERSFHEFSKYGVVLFE